MKFTLTALFLAGCAFAQKPATVAQIYEGPIRTAESEIVSLVEAMPSGKMDFAPEGGEFKGVRTFGEQAKHLAAVVYLCAAAAKTEKVPVDTGGENGPATVKSREEIVKFLKDAFTYARAAAKALTPENETQMVPSPFGQGQMSRGAALQVVGWHSFDHYGQMVVYARMNNVIPPASRPRQ